MDSCRRSIESQNEQILQLESEITRRRSDIQNLTEALATLQAGEPRPASPQVDDTFELLKQLLGNAPQNLEEKAIYGEKLAEAHRALQLATETCQKKQVQLEALKDEARLHEASQLLQQLLGKAQEFNSAIDASFEKLAEMQSLSSQIVRLRGDRLFGSTSPSCLNKPSSTKTVHISYTFGDARMNKLTIIC